MKKLILILICLIFTNTILAQKVSENELANLRKLGVEAFKNENFKESILHLTKIINSKPDYLAYCLRAESFSRQKNTKAEIADYFQAIKHLYSTNADLKQLSEKYENVNYLWARDLLAGDSFDAAIQSYKKYIATNPNNAEAFIVLGFVEQKKGMMSGKSDLAIANYSQAIKLKPTESIFYRLRGAAYLANYGSAELKAKGIQDYTVFLKSNPAFRPTFLKTRALVFSQTGKLKEAIADYTELIKIEPKSVEYLEKRGDAYFDSLDFANAIKDYETYLKSPKSEATQKFTLSKLASAYFRKNDFQKSVEIYSQIINIEPKDVRTLFMRAWCYKNLSQKEKALTDLQKISEISPNYYASEEVKLLLTEVQKLSK